MNRRSTEAYVASGGPTSAQRGNNGLPGSTLVEVLVALGIVAVALTVLVSALQLGVHSIASVHEQTIATVLARSQMETTKAAAWPGPYSAIAAPSGYTVEVASTPGPIAALQLITVHVQHDGHTVLTLEGYKGQR